MLGPTGDLLSWMVVEAANIQTVQNPTQYSDTQHRCGKCSTTVTLTTGASVMFCQWWEMTTQKQQLFPLKSLSFRIPVCYPELTNVKDAENSLLSYPKLFCFL